MASDVTRDGPGLSGDGDGEETFDMTGLSSCDSWSQDCPDGERCVAYASSGATWDANKCVEIKGDKKMG